MEGKLQWRQSNARLFRAVRRLVEVRAGPYASRVWAPTLLDHFQGVVSCAARPTPEPRAPSRGPRGRRQVRYLVDSASSHMLVSKIKPCMSKYKQIVR